MPAFNLRLVSWNVRGFGDVDKTFDGKCKRLVANLTALGTPDVCLLQEHKLSGSCLGIVRRQVWRDRSLWTEARGPSGTCGGLAILLSPTMTACLVQHGEDTLGRFMWATFQTPIGIIGVINMYGPHTSSARALAWRRLKQQLPGDASIPFGVFCAHLGVHWACLHGGRPGSMG